MKTSVSSTTIVCIVFTRPNIKSYKEAIINILVFILKIIIKVKEVLWDVTTVFFVTLNEILTSSKA